MVSTLIIRRINACLALLIAKLALSLINASLANSDGILPDKPNVWIVPYRSICLWTLMASAKRNVAKVSTMVF